MIFRSQTPDVNIPELPLGNYVLQRAQLLGDKPALIDGVSQHTISYKQLSEAIQATASNLSQHGFRKGDVFAIFCPNLPEYAVTFYAVALLGGISTTINSLYTSYEVAFQLNNSGAKYLLTVPQLMDKAVQAADKSKVREIFVIGEATGATSFAALLQSNGKLPETEIDPHEDVVALPYSSGTGGLPKGVMLTHYNLVANLCQVAAGKFIDEQDIVINTLPFSHIYGLHAIMNVGLWNGATIVTLPSFDTKQFLETVQRYSVSFAPVVPPILLALAKHKVVNRYDLSRLKKVICSGAPLGEELAQVCGERLGCTIRQGYGMTETTVTHLSPDAPDEIKLGSVGWCLPNMELQIIEPHSDTALNINQPGEICIRGPQVIRAYLNQPLRVTDEEGWFHTGDLGYIDDEGYLFIVGRMKELIKYKAFQVAPAELEAVLLLHPAISDAAVIPIPDERAGEVPKAFIVLKAESTPEEIMAFVAERVAPYKKIRKIEFVRQIPRSASGKILRQTLINQDKS